MNSMRDRFAMVASQLLDEDERVAVVLADISTDRFRATGAPARHPARVINVGIREQLLVNVAAGMALEGMRPIAHTFASFLVERAFEQVKLGFSHQGVGGVLVSAGASYDEAAYGRTHGAPEDVALVGALPGWRIHVPGHADEVEDLLRDAVQSHDPVYIRLSERGNTRPYAAARRGLAMLRAGGAGSPTIIAVGPTADAAIEATAGIDATVLYAATVRPFDAEGLRAAVRGSEIVLIEPYLQGTSAAEVTAALSDRPIRLLSIGVPRAEDRHYGRAARHDAANGLDAAGLRARISAWLGAGISAAAV
ncbi:MAG TPA: transketolase C-terminal domain-containing protein [Dehalococcoidia bacterium]|nr:transketolase C-terminal domain-containing protein [Dehalococcoidia bacterium]